MKITKPQVMKAMSTKYYRTMGNILDRIHHRDSITPAERRVAFMQVRSWMASLGNEVEKIEVHGIVVHVGYRKT